MKKAMVGWDFIVRLIIGLLILAALIYVAVKAKGGFSGIFGKLANVF